MAALERPKILGRCKCGEILIRYIGEEEPCWTKDESIKRLVETKTEVKEVNCPSHGGNVAFFMGGGYHPSFFQLPITT